MWELIICPVCGDVVHRHYAAPIRSAGRVSSRDYAAGSGLLTAMMDQANWEHDQLKAAAECACVEHFEQSHPLRLRLWHRYRWDWIMNRRWPWSRPKASTNFNISPW